MGRYRLFYLKLYFLLNIQIMHFIQKRCLKTINSGSKFLLSAFPFGFGRTNSYSFKRLFHRYACLRLHLSTYTLKCTFVTLKGGSISLPTSQNTSVKDIQWLFRLRLFRSYQELSQTDSCFFNSIKSKSRTQTIMDPKGV